MERQADSISIGRLFLAGLVSLSSAASPNLPLDHPTTLKNREPFLVEREYHRMIEAGGPASFILPRPCERSLDSSRVCEDPSGWTFQDSARGQALSLSPVAGYEFRRLQDHANAFDFGAVASGYTGPMSFRLDARMFTELHEDFQHPSYDREIVDRQDVQASGSVAYSSYSRYRASLGYDSPWGRWTVGRDAVHWGPALFTNLTFNQASVPFNLAAWATDLGPVSIITIYGQLTIHGDSLGTLNYSHDTRSLYAHRYEWRATGDLLLGLGEQLVAFDREEAFAFIPIIPLFILKGTGLESSNNGNISADISYRLRGRGRLYSEFFIDDLQSPTSLFNDFWANKWAWMAGAHFIRSIKGVEAGAILEYSRVEPWVYTHYDPNSAQAANQGHPLGNPLGPNSQSLIQKVYTRKKESWYASLMLEMQWKGKDLGSGLNDSVTKAVEERPKEFIQGIDSPDLLFTPYAKILLFGRTYAEAELRMGRNWRAVFRAQAWY